MYANILKRKILSRASGDKNITYTFIKLANVTV